MSSLKETIHLFCCPLCQTEFIFVDKTKICCQNNHSFDLAKKGYVNFLLKPVNNQYTKEVFSARLRVFQAGFFAPLLKKIKLISPLASEIKVLDAGCGEGSFLAGLKKDNYSFSGVGLDLAKEGVQIAAREAKELTWCVADLANLPFANNSFDLILNILSPANYREFSRVLNPDGVLIKVLPGKNYLKEFREIFYQDRPQQEYSNEKTSNHFSDNFQHSTIKDLSYDFPLNSEIINDLILMSPLSWGADSQKIEKILNSELPKVTVDFRLISGYKF